MIHFYNALKTSAQYLYIQSVRQDLLLHFLCKFKNEDQQTGLAALKLEEKITGEQLIHNNNNNGNL